MKWIFVVNITSGQGKSVKEINTIHRVMQQANLEYEIIKTEYPGHASAITKTFSKEDDVCIVSVGGDGTIFEVVNGLNEDVPMAILPTGSGNDFFRMIGDQNHPTEELLNDLLDSYETRIDLCHARRDNKDYKFINCTSLGFDADINADAVKIIKNTTIHKNNAYNIGIIKNLLFRKNKEYLIEIDGQKTTINTMLITIMNGKYYGNGFNPTPMADCQDGYLDICHIDYLSIPKILKFIPLYKNGRHLKLKAIHFKKCKHFKLISKNKSSLESDGENYECFKLEIEVLEKALRLRVPKNSLYIK
ncbi:MAG: diacylglycerol kinase family lipid kinase [Erysipelotrichaceae bacterium]|nr:diacylglycerol kinase family lipid kinase [Erysipelotrichaceae bacterium]